MHHLQDSTIDPCVVEPLCRLTGGVALDAAFHEKLVGKIIGITGLQMESSFPPDVKQAIGEIMDEWHDIIKVHFNPLTLDEGSELFEIQGKDILITR